MLFEKFITQYIDDLIDCSDIDYDLTEEDKKELINNIQYSDEVWEVLDNKIYYYLDDYKKEIDKND